MAKSESSSKAVQAALSLVLSQEEIARLINKAYTNYNKSAKSRITKAYVETKLESLEANWNEFIENHSKIAGALKKEDRDITYFTNEIFDNTEELYIDYKVKLKENLDNLTRTHNLLTTTSTSESKSEEKEMRLPEINLPKFSGTYTEWQTFHDMFVSLIHSNTKLSSVQKLHYLKGCLEGEAMEALSDFSVTNSNYEEAWQELNRLFKNKRFNANEVVKKLFNQKSINHPTPSGIKQLIRTTRTCLKAFQNLGIDTKSWDVLTIYLVTSKLDNDTRTKWENSLTQSVELPTFQQLQSFLENRYKTIEMLSGAAGTRQSNVTTKPKTLHATVQDKKTTTTCVMCKGDHHIFNCKKFILYTPKERSEYVQNNKLCFNCLMSNHTVKQCKNTINCRRCGRRHHSLLHIERDNTGGTSGETIQQQSRSLENIKETTITSAFSRNLSPNNVLLATAVVNINAAHGVFAIRALVDQGSQASFVTEKTIQLLGLKRTPVNGWVSGVGDGQTRVKYIVSLSIESRHRPKSILVNAYVLKSLTSMLPSEVVHAPNWSELHNLTLADPDFTTPGKVDILLGAEVFSEIILNGVKKDPSNNLVAQNTVLGWIVSGRLSRDAMSTDIISMHTTMTSTDDLLKKFWELEREPDVSQRALTEEEKQCEELYEKTTTRNNDGRFIVRLPFNSDDPDCQYGKSLDIAERRFLSLERRFKRDPKLHEEYRKVLDEYESLNHMRLVPENEIDNPKAVYLPHHAVVREDKDTTKVRVVFDASCKGINNVSLNDNLLVGPKLQLDLQHLILKWRTHRICIIADLVKMYRQVVVNERDVDYQRVLWRSHEEEPLRHYQLLRLTFGTSSAPYLAVKTLQHLARTEQPTYPIAAAIAQQDLYMDDLMTGSSSEDEAIQIFEELNKLMESGGFKFQKWSSNSEALLKYIGEERERKDDSVVIKIDKTFKILGITWNRTEDTFEYVVNLPPLESPITKRRVVSDIARLFDPLGWVAPAITTAKAFIQKLWLSGIEWDQELPQPLLREWISYRETLHNLSAFRIPRWIHTFGHSDYVELQGFCDASSIAYAAVVYLRVIDNSGEVHVNLLSAKTKVAPVKQVSIPRLELCGAVLLAKLLKEISQVLGVRKENIHAWTDSSIILSWLSGHPSKWKTFVGNRTSEILTIIDNSQWSHVRSGDNPADCASRGIKPQDLVTFDLWKRGPKWLREKEMDYKKGEIENTNLEQKETKAACFNTTIQEDNTNLEAILARFSSLDKMLRVVSYCLRFLSHEKSNLVTVKEKQDTLERLVKTIQANNFRDEIHNLQARGSVLKRSILHILCPFLDAKGILRVGGRINNANVSYDSKHPILLPDKNNLTRLIISDAHIKTLHGGPQVMLTYIRSKYYIVRARSQVKKHFRSCVTCRRYTSSNRTQLMGQIPEVRLKPGKPFQSTGVDYAGPLNIRFSPGRGSKAYKGYICIFVCMVTRAIHLEAVSDLTSKGFIAAFRRFTSRRGRCSDLFSDNGTNFVGANRQLLEMLRSTQTGWPNEIVQLLTLESTTWHFIPPQAPNFGGLWEAGVRSVKTHLRKVIGDSTLTFEELSTVLTQIEACLNSRPLSVLSSDPNDPLPLTPGHFLVGEPLLNLSDKDYSHGISDIDRWNLCQKMVSIFWKRWSNDYLLNLNKRYKWNSKINEPNVNDIVILREENVPPTKWILGVIVQKHPGPDGITRVVSIRCKNGVLKRPTSKVSILTN